MPHLAAPRLRYGWPSWYDVAMIASADKPLRDPLPRLAVAILFMVLLAQLFFSGLTPELDRPNEVFGVPGIGLRHDAQHGWTIGRNSPLAVPITLAVQVESFATSQQQLIAKTEDGHYLVVLPGPKQELLPSLEEAQRELILNDAKFNLPADLKPITSVAPANPWLQNLPRAILSPTMIVMVLGLGIGTWLYRSRLPRPIVHTGCLGLCLVVSIWIYLMIGGGPAALGNAFINFALTMAILSLRRKPSRPGTPPSDADDLPQYPGMPSRFV